MNTVMLTLALLLSSALAQTTAAPPAPATQTIPAQGGYTLAQALAALQRAPGWRSAALQFLSAQQALDAARARAGLSLSAGADVSAALAPLDSGEWKAGATLNVQAALNVLPWSSAQEGIRQAARAVVRAALDQRDAQNTLALTVTQGYLSVLQDQAALAYAQAQLQAATRGLEVARQQQQAGTLGTEGVLDRQISQEQAQSALEDARSALLGAERGLANTLGLPAPAAELRFEGSAPVPQAPAALETLLARAAQSRSEVLRARSSLEDAQALLGGAERDRDLPNLSVSAQLGQPATATAAGGNSLSGGLNFKTGTLSAAASLPLSSSSTPYSLVLGLSGSVAILDPAADAGVRSARTALESAQLALTSAVSSVTLDVQQKYAGFQNALSALTAPRTAVLRAQTAVNSTQARLGAGLATTLDLSSAQLAVQQAQNALSSAVNAAYLASLALSISAGEFSPALVQLSPSAMTLADDSLPAPTGGQP